MLAPKRLKDILPSQFIAILIMLLLTFILQFELNAQSGNCEPTVPFYNVDLTSSPSATFISPNGSRNDNCCSTSSPDRCVEFEIYLHPSATGILFDIYSGAVPSGSMYYQINCGPLITVGQPVCLSGVGPHYLTFCKPGNNPNRYNIQSIYGAYSTADVAVRMGCTIQLQANGLNTSTIVWRDITSGNGSYNSLLSCISQCSSPVFTPAQGIPATINYEVCGSILDTICNNYYYICDTVSVTVYPSLDGVEPDTVYYCSNNAGINISANASGGNGTYTYRWLDSAGTIIATTPQYYASEGFYTLEIRDGFPDCPPYISQFRVMLDRMSVVNAGTYPPVCVAYPTLQLNGIAANVNGGYWSGGTGNFAPDNDTLNAFYTPSTAEINAGGFTLTLTSYPDTVCPTVSEQAIFTFTDSIVVSTTSIQHVSCAGGNNGSFNLSTSGGVAPYSYSIDGNNFQSYPSFNSLSAGNYSVLIRDNLGCIATYTITITEPTPLQLQTVVQNVSCFGGSDGSMTVSVFGGTSIYSYNWSVGGGNAIKTNLTAGTYIITVTDNNGCTASATAIITEPTAMISSTLNSSPSCAGQSVSLSAISNIGTTFNWLGPNGFTASGSNVGVNNITQLNAGIYTVTISNGACSIIDSTVLIVKDNPTTISGSDTSLCNGAIHQLGGNPTASGTAPPYTYQWYPSNNLSSDTVANPYVVATGTQQYFLVVTDSFGCSTVDTTTIILGRCDEVCYASKGPNILGPMGSFSAPFMVPNNSTSATCIRNGLNTFSQTDNIALPKPNLTTYIYAETNGGLFPEGRYTFLKNVGDANGPSCLHSRFHVVDHTGNGGYFMAINGSPNVGSFGATFFKLDSIPVCPNTDYEFSAFITNMLSGIYPQDSLAFPNVSFYVNGTIVATSGPISNKPGFLFNDWIKTGGIWNSGNANYASIRIDNATFVANGNDLALDDISFNVCGPLMVNNSPPGPVCENTSLTITQTVNTQGTNQFTWYKWEMSTDGGNNWADASAIMRETQNPSLFNPSITVTATLAMDGYQYRLLVANDSNSLAVLNSYCFVFGNPVVVSVKPRPVADAGADRLICRGDTAIIGGSPTAVAGTIPYNYSWLPVNSLNGNIISNPAAYPSSLTSYILTVTDFLGCTDTDTISIDVNSQIIISGNIENATCFGYANGEINISVSGGTPPYNYFWSNGATTDDIAGITAAIYNVSVSDATQCQLVSASYTLTEPQPLIVTENINNVSCYGGSDGSINVSVSGGTMPYNFLWNDNVITQNRNFISAGNYSMTITDANGCEIIENDTINEPDEIVISVIKEKVSCNGNNDGAADITVTGGIAPYTFYWSNGETTEDIDSIYAANYSVTVTGANYCTATNSITISEPNILINSQIVLNPSCFGYNDGRIEVTVSGGTTPYIYSWNNGATTQNISALGDGYYSLTVTDANQCNTSLMALLVSPAVINIQADFKNVSCLNGNDGAINISVSGGTAPYNYLWNNTSTKQNIDSLLSGIYSVIVEDNNGCEKTELYEITQPERLTIQLTGTRLICQDDSSGSILASVSGGVVPYQYFWSNGSSNTSISNLPLGNYHVEIQDSNLCVATDSFIIEEYQYSVDFNITDDEVCLGESVHIQDISTSDSIIVSRNWLWGDGAFDNGVNISHRYDSTGTYFVSLKVMTQNGCVDSVSKPVMVYELPVANAGEDVSICPAQYTTLNASGGSTYMWLPDTLLYPINIVSPADTSMYIVKVSNVFGCFDYDTVQVNVHTVDRLNISNDTTVCPGAEVQLIAAGGIGYLWFPVMNLSCYDCSNPIASASSNRKYFVLSKDKNNCPLFDSVSINIAALPEGIISDSDTVCAGTSVQLFAEQGHNYLWQPKNILNNNEIYNPVATPESTTIFSLLITNNYGCSAVDYVTIYVYPKPSINFEDTINICYGASAQILADSQYTYLWSPAEGLSCAVCPSPTVNVSGPTLYVADITTSTGCVSKDTVFIDVMPLPAVYAGDDIHLCNNDEIEIKAVTYGGIIFNWSPPTGLSTTDILNPVVSPSASATYQIEVTDSNGCINKDELFVEVAELNVALDTIQMICEGQPLMLQPDIIFGTNVGITYTWYPQNLFNNPHLPNQFIYPYDDKKITLIAESGNCKPDTQVVFVTVMPVPSVEANAPNHVIADEIFEITTKHFRANQFKWYPETAITCVNERCSKVNAAIQSSTVFTVMVSDTNGCVAYDSVLINVIRDCGDKIFIPNAFTPNGDEFNDRFCVRSLELTGIRIFRIFNRWGQLVFETDNIAHCWDGNFNGNPLNPDVYVYYAEGICTNGKIKLLKGNVTIIR